MKVTINARTGEISFDVADINEAARLAKQLQNGNAAVVDVPAVSETAPDHPRVMGLSADDAGLSYALFSTWEYLVAHEKDPVGVPVKKVARALHLSSGAASHRLAELVHHGYAQRLSKGWYRAALP